MKFEEWKIYEKEADELMKINNGHYYVTILKNRCQNCGKSPKVKTRCGGWFQTYLQRLTEVLLKNGVIEYDKYADRQRIEG